MAMVSHSPICLFGAGGHGRGVAAQMARLSGLVPVFADTAGTPGRILSGVEIRFRSLEEIDSYAVIVTIGAAIARRRFQEEAERLGLEIASFVAEPQRYFATPPGAGSVVLSGAVVNAETVIEAGVIINNSAVVEHGCRIGAFSHVAPGAVIAGDVTLGPEVWVGANATVLQGCTISDRVVIGAGAVVTRDISVPGTYVGQPARLLNSFPVS